MNIINGVGPSNLNLFKNILPNVRIIDLLLHFPTRISPRVVTEDLSNIQNGDIVTLKLDILNYKPNFNKKSPFKILCKTQNRKVILDFFHVNKDYINKNFPLDTTRIVSGKCRLYQGNINIIHPDYSFRPQEFEDFLETIYPMTTGLHFKSLRRFIENAIESLEELPEWQNSEFLKKQKFSNFKESLIRIHKPQNAHDINLDSNFVRRIAYDEFLAMQVALQFLRKATKDISGIQINSNGRLANEFVKNLPFKLTNAQNNVCAEIFSDQTKPQRMARLIQGDVGSGKTVVAAIASLNAIESGMQAALMVPTSIVASQHYEFLKPYFESLGLKVALLTGNVKGKKREKLFDSLASGEINFLIGTHALFYEKVKFKNLGLVTVDEQHRFGVKQRFNLIEKGYKCDFLLMSATPIPRSLALTLYGDLDVSIIDEKPANRKEIDTRIISEAKINEIVKSLKGAIEKGEKAYWICPLVEDSEMLDFTAVEERFVKFKKIFGANVAMVHGKMKPQEKDDIINKFLNNEVKILLGTTVIEVGVNVPDATIMVIENANKFGLSQLHQLRGRIGRGDKQATCILLYQNKKISQYALERLKVIRESNDGFYISEQDLKIRGGGEVLGTKQSGLPTFRIANLRDHYDLLKTAMNDAKLILSQDPNLISNRGQAIRTLLEIFEYDKKLNLSSLV